MAKRNLPKPPDKVREGQIVSARWMNRVVDCLDALVKENGGVAGTGMGSSSSIDSKGLIRNTKFRAPEEVELPVYWKDDFKLRIKPKQFCEVDPEGNWNKVLQVREGHIIDYRGMDQLVPMAKEDGSGEDEEEEQEQQQGDADGKEDAGDGEDTDADAEADGGGRPLDCDKDWHDMGLITDEPLKVYCIIKQDSRGEVTEAYFSTTEEDFKEWGFKSKADAEKYEKAVQEAQAQGKDKPDTHGDNDLDDGSGVVSVLIGQAHSEVVNDEGEKHYYIEQNHSGRIELQVVQVQPFAPVMSGGGSADGSAGGDIEPLCLFLERDVNLFIFKGLYNQEGITLSDGLNIGIGLEYANDGLVAQSDANASETGDQMLGGVNFIKYNSLNSAPHIRHGVVDIPTADTLDRHATGVVNGITVEYVEEGESAQSYIEDGHIHVAIKKFGGGGDGSMPQWGSGSQEGSVPGGGSSEGGSAMEGCGCAAKWQALEAWKASIEARLTALENGGGGGGGGCNCQCLAAGLMDEIQQAIDDAVANVQVRASLSQVLEVTETGELRLDGNVNANANGGNSSVDAHY